MNLQMGSQLFVDVAIPLLWGDRAVVTDEEGGLSVIDLGGERARLEILGDQPAPDVEFRPEPEGFAVRGDGQDLYSYTPDTRTLTARSLRLPDVTVAESEIRVGSNSFSGNAVVGSAVGIVITENGVGMGAPMPPNLAKLVV